MDNSLAIKNPELAKQWHETKNRPFFMLHLVPIKKHGGNVKDWKIQLIFAPKVLAVFIAQGKIS